MDSSKNEGGLFQLRNSAGEGLICYFCYVYKTFIDTEDIFDSDSNIEKPSLYTSRRNTLIFCSVFIIYFKTY